MNTLSVIFSLLPNILSAVVGVETVLKTASTTTETKKQIVLSVIDAVARSGETYDNVTVASISALVDNLVSVLNTTSNIGEK